MLWEIAEWYCCLNDRERAVLALTISGEALSLFEGIPVGVWEAFWLPFSGVTSAVVDAFIFTYKLEIVTIVIEELPVDVVVVRGAYFLVYLEWVGFLLTVEATCPQGCQLSSFS